VILNNGKQVFHVPAKPKISGKIALFLLLFTATLLGWTGVGNLLIILRIK
jgi:hypothetical protein